MSDPNVPPEGGWFGERSGDRPHDDHDEVDLLADSFAELDAALDRPPQPGWVELPVSANPAVSYDTPSWLTLPGSPEVAPPVVSFDDAGVSGIETDRPRPDDSYPTDLVVPGWLDATDDVAAEQIPTPTPLAGVDAAPVSSHTAHFEPEPQVAAEPVVPVESAYVEPVYAEPQVEVEPVVPVESAYVEPVYAEPLPVHAEPLDEALGFEAADLDGAHLDDSAPSTVEPPDDAPVELLGEESAIADGVVPPTSDETWLLEDAALVPDPDVLPPPAPIRTVPLSEDEPSGFAVTEMPTTPVAGVPVIIPQPESPPPMVDVPVRQPLLPFDPPVRAPAPPPQPPTPATAPSTPPPAPAIDAFDRPLARVTPSPRVTQRPPQRPSQPIVPFDTTGASPVANAPAVPLIPDRGSGRAATTTLAPLVPTPAGFLPKPAVSFQQTDVVAALENVPPARFSRFLTWMIPLLLVGLGVSAYVLAQQGAAEFLDSTGGRLQTSVTDPEAPGYVALVDPTPSMLMLWTDGLGHLSGVSLLSAASDDEGGSVLVMPPFTRFRPGDDTLYAAFEAGGVEAVENVVSRHLRIAFGETELIDGDRWEQLLAPVEPLPIVVTDPLITRNDAGAVGVRFPAGTAAIDAEDIVDFLGWRNPDEVQLNQQFRHGQFWDSWIGAVFDGGVDAVPGESETGVGRFVRSLANGQANIELLSFTEERSESVAPTTDQSDAAVPAEAITVIPDAEALEETIVAMIPFPVAPVSSPRPRVRLLDGVDNTPAVLQVAERLVAAGAQIAILGNADTFEIDQSRIVYHVGDAEADAQSYADALGTSGVEGDSGSGLPADEALTEPEERIEQRTIDVTVVVGADILSGLNE